MTYYKKVKKPSPDARLRHNPREGTSKFSASGAAIARGV